MSENKVLEFGSLEIGADGNISIRRSPANVIYIRWGDKWPVEPPSAENWLVPKNRESIRFMYHPGSGLVLFSVCIQADGISHASMVSKLANGFDLLLPQYGEWVRPDSRWKKSGRSHIKVDYSRLGYFGAKSKRRKDLFRVGFGNFRAMMRRLKTLKAVPANYMVRIQLESKRIAYSVASDWWESAA